MAAKAIASAPRSSNAKRQTSRSRRVSRSRSEAAEVDSAESPARGVDVLTIRLCLEGLPDRQGPEDDLARKLWALSLGRATRGLGADSQVVNRDWRGSCVAGSSEGTRSDKPKAAAQPIPGLKRRSEE